MTSNTDSPKALTSFFLCLGLPLQFHNFREYNRNNDTSAAMFRVPVHKFSWIKSGIQKKS
jgi:hypothetical protein